MDDQEAFPLCYHDNRLRELAASLLYSGDLSPSPSPGDCLAWLIDQPEDAVFRACMFRGVNLPVYGRDEWFLLGWREKTPTFPRLIEPLHECQLETETINYLKVGNIVRLETEWLGDLWNIAVKSL